RGTGAGRAAAHCVSAGAAGSSQRADYRTRVAGSPHAYGGAADGSYADIRFRVTKYRDAAVAHSMNSGPAIAAGVQSYRRVTCRPDGGRIGRAAADRVRTGAGAAAYDPYDGPRVRSAKDADPVGA